MVLASSLTIIASKAIHATDLDVDLPEGFVRIENEDLYNALKDCLTDGYCKVISDATETVEFDDETQSLSHPEIVNDIYLNSTYTGIELTDISELAKFPNLKWLNLNNNKISDISVINQENFPNLENLALYGNCIESFASLDEGFNRQVMFDGYRLAQTLTYKPDENGVAKLPPLLKELIEGERMGRKYELRLNIHNLEMSSDFEKVRILDPSKEAYITASMQYERGNL